jgi:rhamnosyltransferase
MPDQRCKVIVPTLNAARDWPRFVAPLLACVAPEQVLIMDSASTDGTPRLATEAGFQVNSIPRAEFNHGGTRQLAAELSPEAEVLVYMTQDAVLAHPDSLPNLLAVFSGPEVAAVYGRQLPRPEAGAIEAHARNFNYPAVSDVRDLASRERIGLKSIFISNSFAAYRRSSLFAVGGFRRDVIFGEDTLLAAKLLLKGYKVCYAANACVYHSHGYSWGQEFRRYFDIGVLHDRERALLGRFGGADREGQRFVISELKFLREHDPGQIPSALVRTGLKYLGYRLGRMEGRLGDSVKRRISMQPSFWAGEGRAESGSPMLRNPIPQPGSDTRPSWLP